MKRLAALGALAALCTWLLAQGPANNPWDEIHFKTNSATLLAKYPSLVHLAELLRQHPGYRVKITGYAAHYGSAQPDDRLAQRRAETIRIILLKYGAAPGQISVSGAGKPELNQTRTVDIVVTDSQGRAVPIGREANQVPTSPPAKLVPPPPPAPPVMALPPPPPPPAPSRVGTGRGGQAGPGGQTGPPGNEAPAQSIPPFEWPPPRASAQANIPPAILTKNRTNLTMGDIANSLETAFQAAGYVQFSYYAVPQGFALVSQLEQINSDGTPKDATFRWQTTVAAPKVFSISSYFRALLGATPGDYRVVVFIVTPTPLTTQPGAPGFQQAQDWLTGGANKLPDPIRGWPFTADTSCTALIYEFEQASRDANAIELLPSGLTGQMHLQAAGLWSALQR
jgi:hypothetical protein